MFQSWITCWLINERVNQPVNECINTWISFQVIKKHIVYWFDMLIYVCTHAGCAYITHITWTKANDIQNISSTEKAPVLVYCFSRFQPPPWMSLSLLRACCIDKLRRRLLPSCYPCIDNAVVIFTQCLESSHGCTYMFFWKPCKCLLCL
jgi:hypothetical protein